MSLCQHGYTSHWDCPICECSVCGRTQDSCVCHLDPFPGYHGAAGPLPVVEKPEESEEDRLAADLFWIAVLGAMLP